jgi:hypothetical protein
MAHELIVIADLSSVKVTLSRQLLMFMYAMVYASMYPVADAQTEMAETLHYTSTEHVTNHTDRFSVTLFNRSCDCVCTPSQELAINTPKCPGGKLWSPEGYRNHIAFKAIRSTANTPVVTPKTVSP